MFVNWPTGSRRLGLVAVSAKQEGLRAVKQMQAAWQLAVTLCDAIFGAPSRHMRTFAHW